MYTIEEGRYWQLQEAKAKFSAVIRSAKRKPQIITLHGKEDAVVLSMEAYRKLTAPKESLVSFLEQSPWAGLNEELPGRASEKMREIDL